MNELQKLFGEYAYYFKLIPSPERVNWVQMSFGQFSSEWPILPNPAPSFRNEIIIRELSQFCNSSEFFLLNNGKPLEGMYFYEGFVVDLRFDYAEAAIAPHAFYHSLKDIVFFLE